MSSDEIIAAFTATQKDIELLQKQIDQLKNIIELMTKSLTHINNIIK